MSSPSSASISAAETTAARNSPPALAVLAEPRSRSMPALPDPPSSHVPTQPTGAVSDGQRDSSEDMEIIPVPRRRNSFALFTTASSPANPSSALPASKEKKMRPMSITSLFTLNNQFGSARSRPPHQPKAQRWASRGGIGTKNEMLVELETTGVFVPSKGQRLREEFVYQTVTQCADEIRGRGLDHPNIFYNPAPKKVISSMIDLMTDQQRCNLFAIQCLRIDTVASLMLNVLSQMSNPVIPYSVMEHYFQQGLPTARSNASPSSRRHSAVLRMGLDELPLYMLAGLPAIPALPIMNHISSGTPSHATIAWARMNFDLAAFLGALPLMNRVILLEVLHVCHEVLEHQGSNRLTLARVVAQIAPALFSTVFDQKMLEKMVGGTRRFSIHCDSISSYEGNLAENHLLTVILVRFIYLTVNSRSNSTSSSPRMPAQANHNQLRRKSSPSLGRSSYHSGSSGLYDYNGYDNTMYHRSQEHMQQEQDAYYMNMVRPFQEMEMQQRHQQQYGQYGQHAQYAQPRPRRQRLRHHYNPEDCIPEAEYAPHLGSIHPLEAANLNIGYTGARV
ncbi:hypothetical protein BGZ70_010635 [Mortierella alpina]|uniref:Rho-GAP domain-containing protein n=1 Tax=Mortierella alpina TaxID=64518 RepID=A0A9P6LZF4_MORAP|nr:hypothetical protein BGZ70_010635 [Mortierella alpina]